ncbi:hypothetical protein EVG20_g8986 [Dentipellis fragilis]|uniref:Uncharacterized protein n=1 Tax=Dentipellis fragilis TaxID=205917 RepID=A0A4Y9Y3D6_9AGAM|nr:hypothetical protein EVG20_g8986 [Dentipellis fragilis]
MDAAALNKLTRRNLQELAKTYKVKANAKSAKIIQDLIKLHPQGVPLPRKDSPEQSTPASPAQAQAQVQAPSPPPAPSAPTATPNAPSTQVEPTEVAAPTSAGRKTTTPSPAPEPPVLPSQQPSRSSSPSPAPAPAASGPSEPKRSNKGKVELNSDADSDDLFPPCSPLRNEPTKTPLFDPEAYSRNGLPEPDRSWLRQRATAPRPRACSRSAVRAGAYTGSRREG